MTRRTMLGIVALGGGGLVAWRRWPSASVVEAGSPAVSSEPKAVTIVDFSDAGLRQAAKEVPTLVKTEAEWRRQLSPISFEVTRHAATEWPFTGATWNLHDSGIYRCVCCETALFSSETKFESGTGWPSFWTPLDKKNIVEESDRSFCTFRTAVSCRRCDAHLGHVFDDGPRPTGLRYCMNSAAMRFAKARQEKAS